MKKYKSGWLVLLAVLLLGLLPASSMADEAKTITEKCKMYINDSLRSCSELRDGKYSTYFGISRGRSLTVEADEDIGFIVLYYDDVALPAAVSVPDGEGWREIGQGGAYLTQTFDMPEGTRRVKIDNLSGGVMNLAELRVFSVGEDPIGIPRWKEADKADMMLVVAHPDDEILWFSGLLPTYAGERGLNVQVVCFIKASPLRRLELLNSLATCGVSLYPKTLSLRDIYMETVWEQYQHWNKNSIYGKLISIIREMKPDVVVCQAFSGEYGHGGHKVVAEATSNCVTLCADPEQYPESVATYGVWQPHKVYIHLYEENQITMDWHVPLKRFGGLDAYAVAEKAMACHISQSKRWKLEDGGKQDNRVFGLFLTDVGPDVKGVDMMENIP